jgi:ectoine hydroxylase-related dioxygenase (phytanoyl-CoA dioxygenase family)
MTVPHLPADCAADDVVASLREHGCAVVDELVPPAWLDDVATELAPFVEATPFGPDDFSGRRTRRTGGLVARSPSSHRLVQHPLVLAAVAGLLADGTGFQLHLTQLIGIGPGEPAQPVHRDQWAFDFFPFPPGYEAQCNTIWAMTDFTEANGGTRVIPGSHRHDDGLRYSVEDTEAVEMGKGSVLLYTGSLYHGGGPNSSASVRRGVNITYCRSWLRQEENQYLTVPHDVAVTLPDDLLRLMGYARGAYALGYVDDLRDPLAALRGTASAPGFAP